eukprot:Gb_22850 [translate_table: standard]
MSALSYNPLAVSSFQFYQNPSSDWGLLNSAMDMQSCFNSGGEQHFFFWEPTSVLDLATSPSVSQDKINSFTAIPTTQEDIEVAGSRQTILSYREGGPAPNTQDISLWEGQIFHKQSIPLILRASERDCFENNLGYSDCVSMSTVMEEKYVLDSLYQGFDVEDEGIVPSKAFGELPFPFFEDEIDAMDSLGTAQNSCSASNPSKIVGSCSSASLNSLDQLNTEFTREMEGEYPCDFEAVLAFQQPPLPQQDLVQILVKCAEALIEGQHSPVDSMLAELQEFSSPFGDPLQRISFYASEALKKHTASAVKNEENGEKSSFSEREFDLACQALYQFLPYHKFVHFTSNQAILEAVDNASYIHVIDLDVRQGLQWPSFLQSLALRPGGGPKLVKITALGKDEKRLKQTGRRLQEFAESMEIALVFQPVTVEVENLDESVFNIEAHETVAVNCSVVLNRLLCKPGKIQGLLSMLRKLKPTILTVMEIESNQNMPSPVSRFLQCLVLYRAIFQSIEASMERNSPDRVLIERVYVAPNICSVLSNDRRENPLRYACIDSWRKFLRHSGFKDCPLSQYSQCQANLLLGLYSNESFKLHQDGFSICLAWQDTPIVSVSAWTC